MKIYPEKLAANLNQQLLPVYLISGDEPLLVQECCDLVRRRAREDGCTEREVIDTKAAGFNWQDLLHSASSLSLFGGRKLVELRLPDGKPGAEGGKALGDYLGMMSGSDILLIVSGKIDRQSTTSRWYQALDAAGATVQVWPVGDRELPRWLQSRVESAGMRIDQDALQLLCERVEGNLLAAVQEVEKLKLLATDDRVTAATITHAVSDNARYNLFDMTDKALAGDATTSLRMLHGLRGAGTEPAVALWTLAREIRTLYQVRLDCERGQSVQQALNARRVWKNRFGLMQSALARHDCTTLSQLLGQAARVDGSIKGFADGRPWDNLEDLVIGLSAAAASRPVATRL